MDDVKKMYMGELGVRKENKEQIVENNKRDIIRFTIQIVCQEDDIKLLRDELILRLQAKLKDINAKIQLYEHSLSAGHSAFMNPDTFTDKYAKDLDIQHELEFQLREHRDVTKYLKSLVKEIEL